jgi:hypothetical protein
MFDSRTFADIRVIRVPAIANQIRRGQMEQFETRIAANSRECPRIATQMGGINLGVLARFRAFSRVLTFKMVPFVFGGLEPLARHHAKP